MIEIPRPDGGRVHCGDVLRVRIGEKWVWGRFELDPKQQWYVVVADYTYEWSEIEAVDFATRE